MSVNARTSNASWSTDRDLCTARVPDPMDCCRLRTVQQRIPRLPLLDDFTPERGVRQLIGFQLWIRKIFVTGQQLRSGLDHLRVRGFFIIKERSRV
ncbi:hypothetical protein AVEN_36974-1 [Araneus ventricosus]|uniref:Uncharacterized protein n=1 Tax=Araneus ventricosus TaxID=182803 RepID=A0A4Y2IFB7_ARAVE|nr:hypothetical protein AVEN_36974-1 [Araneus ventricosus]